MVWLTTDIKHKKKVSKAPERKMKHLGKKNEGYKERKCHLRKKKEGGENMLEDD